MSSGFSLDDILSETEKDTEKVPGKLWSLAEIDALLADEGLSESENVQTDKAHEPKEQTEHAEKKYESAEERNGKTPVIHTSKKDSWRNIRYKYNELEKKIEQREVWHPLKYDSTRLLLKPLFWIPE